MWTKDRKNRSVVDKTAETQVRLTFTLSKNYDNIKKAAKYTYTY